MSWLDVSNNPALTNFEFGDASESHVETLLMNDCALRSLNGRRIKQTLSRLNQLMVNKNNFSCDHLTQQIMELKAMNVYVVGDYRTTNGGAIANVDAINDDHVVHEEDNDDGEHGGDDHYGAVSEAKNVNGIRCY